MQPLSDPVNLQIPLCILLRLLRQHSLVVSEFHCLDQQSKLACCRALKASLLEVPGARAAYLTQEPLSAVKRRSTGDDQSAKSAPGNCCKS